MQCQEKCFVFALWDLIKDEIGRECSMYMRDEKTSQTLVGKPEGKDCLEGLGMDEELVFIWTLKKSNKGAWIEFI